MSKQVEELIADKASLEIYLKEQAWLKRKEKIVDLEKPGEGNMNFTLRIKTEERSFIIKQSRDYVEKYPQVAAPEERALQEAEFYQLIASESKLKEKMPQLLGVDYQNHVLNLQDLGNGVDYTFLYQKDKHLEDDELKEIITFAANLHQSINVHTTQKKLANRKMRQLNHEHMFIYPYLENNGLNLDDILPGLREIGDSYKKDELLKSAVKKLGQRYLKDGNTLLHGDYFPGSWLKTENGLKIIDPEFCFFGDVEFEIGVMLAHLKMANQSDSTIKKGIDVYKDLSSIDEELCRKFMAVELLRRILGLAQLPLSLNLEERKTLLNESREILV